MDKQEIKQKLDAYLAENLVEEKNLSEVSKTPLGSAAGAAIAGTLGSSLTIGACLGAVVRVPLANVLSKFFEKNKGETFSEMMIRLVEESGEKASAIYNRAQIDRQLFSRIKKNKNYQPSKDTVVSLAFALKLNRDKVDEFLAAAGYSLNKSMRDLIITFFIENKLFDTAILNDCLYEHNQPLLLGR